MYISSVAAALAYAGVGAGVGTIGAAMIQARSSKGESRAHAADLLAEGYSDFSDRLTKENKRLSDEVAKFRKLLVRLSDAMDILIDPTRPNPPDEELVALAKETNDAVKEAL